MVIGEELGVSIKFFIFRDVFVDETLMETGILDVEGDTLVPHGPAASTGDVSVGVKEAEVLILEKFPMAVSEFLIPLHFCGLLDTLQDMQ